MKNICEKLSSNEAEKIENTNPSSLRQDVDSGFRFLHFMEMQTKHDLIDINSRLFSLIEELVAGGLVDLQHLDERRLRIREGEAERLLKERVHVEVDNTEDKYSLEKLPKVGCESRIDICKARCCKLGFPLSFQDLDEHIVQWDYSLPYYIKQNSDGICVHRDECYRCSVYKNRPAFCREYDCRNDERIWVDFEKGILASEDTNQENSQKDGIALVNQTMNK